MADASHYLVSFEDVSATVGGYDISSIVELHLTASANGIPEITLLVDAKNSGGTAPQVASAMTLDNARDVLDTCSEMVKTDGATLSLSLTVRSTGPSGGDTQSLSLTGWLLTDVALSPIQESGVCTVALTFQHPICKAHFGGAVPGLLAAPVNFLNRINESNPLDAFLEALRVYGEEAERNVPITTTGVDGASDSATIRDNLLGRLSKATNDLAAALKWTSGGLPASNQLGGWDNLICAGIANYALPDGGTSVYQMFSSLVVPECSLAIGGDFTGQTLDVGPFTPWASASRSISERDIISLQFPQNDPSPISGVHLLSNDTAISSLCSHHVDGAQSMRRPTDIFYVPDSELQADYLYGPIHQFREPGWMSMMKSVMLTVSDKGRSDVKSGSSGNFQSVVTIGRGNTASFSSSGQSSSPAISYGSAMLACAKAYYETSLMKDWVFTVNTRLMFDSGGILCPGKVLSVKSSTSEVVAGYIVGVTHTISVANRSAHTSVICSHPRFGSLPDGVSEKNSMYS